MDEKVSEESAGVTSHVKQTMDGKRVGRKDGTMLSLKNQNNILTLSTSPNFQTFQTSGLPLCSLVSFPLRAGEM